MPDVREQALARLADILQDLPGVTFAGRNTPVIDDTMLPAVELHDGSLRPEAGGETTTRRGWNQPRKVIMQPLVIVKAQERSEALGTALNAIWAKVLKAVADDTELPAIFAEVDGWFGAPECDEPMLGADDMGRKPTGEMQITLPFGYLLYPDDL